MFWDIFMTLCEENNIRPNPLGKKLSISSGIITKWKNGATPSTENLIKISDYFNVSIDYLLGKTEYPVKIDEELAGQPFALYGEIHDLTYEEKEKILEFIKFTKSQRKEENK